MKLEIEIENVLIKCIRLLLYYKLCTKDLTANCKLLNYCGVGANQVHYENALTNDLNQEKNLLHISRNI